VIDYVDGRADLEAGILRAIGDPDQRFAEDHLRMLRAVRFARHFDFQIEPTTAEAIRKQAARIAKISPERIREELEKILSHPSRALAVREIAELELLGHLWLGAQWSSEQLDRVIKVITALPDDADFVLAFAGLLGEFDLAEVKRAGRELRCSNQQIDDAAWLVKNRLRLDETEEMSLAEFKKLLAHERFDDLLTFHKAVCLSQNKSLDGYNAAIKRRATIPPDEIAPPPLVTGEDLIEMGLEPGPRFKEILEKLYDEQLNKQLNSRGQALEKLHNFINDSK